MAQPVWVLSVDLQTKTATFVTGMGDAARSARGAFGEISHGAGKMSHDVRKGSIDVQHSIGLVDNFIRGAHSQAIADMVREYQSSALVMKALPLAATAAGIGLIGGIAFDVAEKIKAMREEEEKLASDTLKFGTAADTAFRSLDDKLLAAEKQADELNGNHLAALKKQLTLIDHASMSELVHSFGLVAKAADAAFADMKSHWYSFGTGSEGAKHALDEFQAKYESLLAKGDSKGASDLLAGTLASAKKILATQQQALAESRGSMPHAIDSQDAVARLMGAGKRAHQAALEKEIASQQQLVNALSDQVSIEQRIAAIKKQEGDNATHQTGREMAAKASAAARESIETRLKMGESAIAADKVTADARMTIQHATLEQRLASDISFADREYQIQLAAKQQEIANLDKSGKDYQAQLKSLNDKKLEIEQQHETQVAGLKARAAVEINQRDIQAVEQGIRAQIGATQEGSAARLSAIDAGIREEQARHLQDTDFYKELLTQRVGAARQEAQQESKIAFQTAEAQLRMREQAEQEQARHRMQMLQIGQGSGNVVDVARVALVQQQMELEYQIKRMALEDQLRLYRQSGQDQVRQAKQTEIQLELLDKQHADRAIELQAQQAQAMRSTWALIETGYANMFMNVLEGHQSLTVSLGRLADEAANRMIAASLKVIAGNKSEQLSDAKTAAAGAYRAMSSIPIIGPELGAAAAAMVFAGAMAFEKGGIVPGVGHGDVVPAMLTPGEGVVPGGVMDGLRNMARHGGFEHGKSTIHVHVRPTYNVQTIDGDGMSAALEKHSDQLEKHFHNVVRKMNH